MRFLPSEGGHFMRSEQQAVRFVSFSWSETILELQ